MGGSLTFSKDTLSGSVETNAGKEMDGLCLYYANFKIKIKDISLPNHSQESIQYFHFMYSEGKTVSKGLLPGLWHFFLKNSFILKAQSKCHHF